MKTEEMIEELSLIAYANKEKVLEVGELNLNKMCNDIIDKLKEFQNLKTLIVEEIESKIDPFTNTADEYDLIDECKYIIRNSFDSL